MRGERPTERAFLPSDFGRPPERRSRPESIHHERADARRGETEHVRALRVEVERRIERGDFLYGEEPGSDVARVSAENIYPLDMDRGVDDPCPCDDVTRRSSVSETETTAEAPRAEAKAETKPAKAKKVKKSKAKKPKASKKVARKVKKVVKAIKKSIKRQAKKYLPRAKRDDVPCCINLERKLLNKVDARAKRDGLSRSKLIQQTMAKKVGYKVAV